MVFDGGAVCLEVLGLGPGNCDLGWELRIGSRIEFRTWVGIWEGSRMESSRWLWDSFVMKVYED
jgi:hypothetical protein